jgi:hypothetical protein
MRGFGCVFLGFSRIRVRLFEVQSKFMGILSAMIPFYLRCSNGITLFRTTKKGSSHLRQLSAEVGVCFLAGFDPVAHLLESDLSVSSGARMMEIR